MRTGPSTDVAEDAQVGLLQAMVVDGRPLLALLGVGLVVAGVFALFLSATNTFLPQDVAFLGMDRVALCGMHQCRIVHFIFHDRVSFGGTLIAVGTLYLWLQAFPLRRGEEWAWWTLLLSGAVGFASFLCYLIFHYLDTWHATASAALLPLYVCGMTRSRALLQEPREGVGRCCLLFVGVGMVAAGITIMLLGSTVVFVPQDITYFGYTPGELHAINPRLMPLIAHDRAGFGGGLASCGVCVFLVVWKSRISRALWQTLLAGGLAGFGCAIGIHYPMGYLSASHLLPACVGAAVYVVGIVAVRPGRMSSS